MSVGDAVRWSSKPAGERGVNLKANQIRQRSVGEHLALRAVLAMELQMKTTPASQLLAEVGALSVTY